MKPQGSQIVWTDADLDALAEITPTDAKAAAALWRLVAPPWAKNLLDARPKEDTA